MQDAVFKNNIPTILVVEDDRTTLMMLETRLIDNGYKVLTAVNGESAKALILENYAAIDAVLMDRMLPGIDGIEVVYWIKKQEDLAHIPIIMQTGANQPESIKEGINCGVFYYLTKPIEETVLKSVVASAVRESLQRKLLKEEMGRHKRSFKSINRCEFELKTLEQAENVACFLANCYPNPEKALPGLAALIINAIEHGNLGITYEEKSELIKQGQWLDEINKRQAMSEYEDKKVIVIFTKENGKYCTKISDEGKGFVWQKFMRVDPSRSLDNHGRGIARANMIFDKVEYNKVGNELIAVIDEQSHRNVEW